MCCFFLAVIIILLKLFTLTWAFSLSGKKVRPITWQLLGHLNFQKMYLVQYQWLKKTHLKGLFVFEYPWKDNKSQMVMELPQSPLVGLFPPFLLWWPMMPHSWRALFGAASLSKIDLLFAVQIGDSPVGESRPPLQAQHATLFNKSLLLGSIWSCGLWMFTTSEW